MCSVFVEDGMDKVQNKLRKQLLENKQAQAALGRGILAYFLRQSLVQERREILERYWERAEQLGLKAKYGSGSHG